MNSLTPISITATFALSLAVSSFLFSQWGGAKKGFETGDFSGVKTFGIEYKRDSLSGPKQ